MATNLNHLSEESAILSLKILLRSYPYGVEIREVNGLFIRRFGVQLDPLSYDCFSLQKFLLKIAKYDGSFIIIESRIKLSKSYMEKVDIANSVLLSKPPSGPQEEDVWRSPSEEEDNREKEFPLGLPEASTTGYPKVVFGAFDASFSDDKSDYLSRYDTVPSLNLSRPIRRGDFLEIKIVSIQNPQSFQVRILGPKDLTETNVFTKMSVFTQRISNFYYAYKGQKILQVSSHDFPLDGGVFACPYTSSRSGKVEWRRALVTTRVDSNRHLVYFFDHGLYCEVDYRCLKKLYRPFADIPVQAIEAQMAGIAPFDKCLWNSSEKTFFKRAVARCKKHVMLALVIQRVEQPIRHRLRLIMVNPEIAYPHPNELKSSCLNFQMLKGGYAAIDEESEDVFFETWKTHDAEFADKVKQLQATVASKKSKKSNEAIKKSNI